MKKLLSIVLVCCAAQIGLSQTMETLKQERAEKKDSIAAIQGRLNAINKQIEKFPGWKVGAFGIIGGSISEFNNWYAQGSPNNSTGRIGFSVNPFARLDREQYFWYNAAQINLGWLKFDDKDDPDDDDSFRAATDVFNVSSLFGYKLTSKLAISTLGEYRTTLLDNFNDPGYLDIGMGGTWTPLSGLTVVVHPFNYNFVFSDASTIFDSSFGAKILATYDTSIGALKLKSVLSAFESYKDSNLSNWTWTNAVSYKLWKMIGLGFEFGLRDNKQEALNYAVNTLGETDATFGTIDNDLQSYWLFGLTYEF